MYQTSIAKQNIFISQYLTNFDFLTILIEIFIPIVCHWMCLNKTIFILFFFHLRKEVEPQYKHFFVQYILLIGNLFETSTLNQLLTNYKTKKILTHDCVFSIHLSCISLSNFILVFVYFSEKKLCRSISLCQISFYPLAITSFWPWYVVFVDQLYTHVSWAICQSLPEVGGRQNNCSLVQKVMCTSLGTSYHLPCLGGGDVKGS